MIRYESLLGEGSLTLSLSLFWSNVSFDPLHHTCQTILTPILRETRHSATWIHPTLMLRDLLASDLMSYPTSIYIGDYSHHSAGWDDGREYDRRRFNVDTGRDGTSEVDRALEPMLRDLEPLLTACPYLEEQDALKHCILKEGDIGTTLGFILIQLPNLASIYITDCGRISDGSENFNTVVGNIVATGQTTGRSGIPSLSKLTYMSLSRNSRPRTGNDWDLAFLWPLFHLPSLRSLHGHNINASGNDWSYAQLRSHIEELDLDDSFIDHQSFDTYLKDIESLRKFRFHRDDTIDWAGRKCPLPRFVQSLVQYAGHSLQSLEITVDFFSSTSAHGGFYFIGTLKALQVLEYLRVGGPIFMESAANKIALPYEVLLPAGRVHRLIDMLPTSILRVEFNYGVKKSETAAMLAGLPELKEEHVPNLQAIHFPQSLCATPGKERATKRAYSDAGILLMTRSH